MSSAPDSIAAGTTLQHYRLIERLGGAAQTWIAEDTRNGNRVAVKILSRLLPKDKASRDGALKQLRLRAAIGHPGIATIIHLDIDQDVLWMASELVEGETLTRRAAREKATKQDFLRYAWQMADVLAAVHRGSVVLGQITGDSWIITPDNDVKLVSFRFSSFMGKHETGQTLLSTIKQTNLRDAAYLSPEQVTGKMVTSKSDIFAMGVCLYELIAGNVPFQGASVADVANAVNTSAPPAPQNPAIERAMLAPVGKCIQKNPDSRYEKIALIQDDLAKFAPEVETLARRRGVTSPGGIPIPKKPPAETATETFIVVGELPYHELLRSKDPDRAGRLENTMQQYLSEAVYLFDGTVLDSLGPVMVASLPDGKSAIRAAKKGLADLVEHNMSHGDEPVEARMLVHYGELVPTAGKPEGAGLSTARSVLEAMEPLQLLVSKPVIDRVDVQGEPVSIGRLAEIDFYQAPEIREVTPEPEPTPEVPPASPTPVTASPDAEAVPQPPPPAAAAVAEALAAKSPPKKGLPIALIGAAAVLVLIVGVVGAFLVLKRTTQIEEAPIAQPAPRPAPAAPAAPEFDSGKVFFAGFEVDTPTIPSVPESATTDPASEAASAAPEISEIATDEELATVSAQLQSAVVRLISLDRGLESVPAPAGDVRSIGGRLTRTEDGIVLTPVVTEGDSESENGSIAVIDPTDAALEYVRNTWPALGRDVVFLPGDPATVVSYLDALDLRDRGELEKALAAAEAVTAVQSSFTAAQHLQMDLLLSLDRQDEAIETAKRLALLDPTDTEIRRRLADWEFSRGNPGYALVWLGELLQAEPENVDILTRIGQYAVAVGNQEKLGTILQRLQPLGVEHPRLSEGDMILARGRLDAAAKKYYEDLNTQPDNPILALKIGRLAVLRRSDSVIQAEIEKLEKLQTPFELAMMRAYIDANEGNAEGAEMELQRAVESASPLDPVFTASAEVYLLLNRQQQVLESLEKAVSRAEPTHEYILSNPIFAYLANDQRFRSVLQTLGEQRAQISAALERIQL